MSTNSTLSHRTITGDYPPLPAEQQLELCATVRAGMVARRELVADGCKPKRRCELRALIAAGKQARDTLILTNSRLILKVALDNGQGMPIDDLFQQGVLGFMNGLRRFDPDAGVVLSTHVVYWIRQAITRYTAQHCRYPLRIPVYLHYRLGRLRRKQQELATELGRKPTHAEVEEVCVGDVPYFISVGDLFALGRGARSLDEAIFEGDDDADALVDLLQADGPPIYTQAELGELADTISVALADLPDRERDIIMRRFALGDYQEQQTLEEIAHAYQLTRERIRQLEQRAMHKLRHPRWLRILRDFRDVA